MARLDNWCMITAPISPYTPPECAIQRLSGIVFNSPKFADGTDITTSAPVAYRDGKVITKSGSEYELGTIEPEYEKLFPNARERFIKSLQENAHE